MATVGQANGIFDRSSFDTAGRVGREGKGGRGGMGNSVKVSMGRRFSSEGLVNAFILSAIILSRPRERDPVLLSGRTMLFEAADIDFDRDRSVFSCSATEGRLGAASGRLGRDEVLVVLRPSAGLLGSPDRRRDGAAPATGDRGAVREFDGTGKTVGRLSVPERERLRESGAGAPAEGGTFSTKGT